MRRPASAQEPGDHDPAAQQSEHHDVPFRSREAASQSTHYTTSDDRQTECSDSEVVATATVYGKYDAEDESVLPHIRQLSPEEHNAEIVTALPEDPSCVPRHYADQQWFDPMTDDIQLPSKDDVKRRGKEPPAAAAVTPLFSLPPELIHAILTHLSALDLASLSAVCWKLREFALTDAHWHRCVQHNVPGVWLTKPPTPCQSFRELYIAHERLWFLTRYKIWFSDRDLMGKLVVARFDHQTGCIAGYELLATCLEHRFAPWSIDSKVVVHQFTPEIRLHLDKPVLQFHVESESEGAAPAGANRFSDEMPMTLDKRQPGMFRHFQLARPLHPQVADERLHLPYPYSRIWPPPTIPARHHAAGAGGTASLEPRDRPSRRSETSDQTFRIHQWMELAGTPVPQRFMDPNTGTGLPSTQFAGMQGSSGVHIGEEVNTYSTLDPVLYTPTPAKPWRGLWVGDYGGHGCEFMLFNQPNVSDLASADSSLTREPIETDAEWEKRCQDARLYSGRLEIIKLTGDPNVPRGEYTIVADDIGAGGLVGEGSGPEFAGARVVKAKALIANRGFMSHKYISADLIFQSQDQVACYLHEFGHIMYFHRVDLAPLLKVEEALL